MPERSFTFVMTRAVPGILIVATLVVAALVIGLWRPPDADAATKLTKAEKQLVRLINAERKKRGLRPVRVRTALCRAADRHSRDMLARDFFSHRSSNGCSMSSRLQRHGYRRSGCSSWSVGEVLARGRKAGATPRATLRAFLRSKSHRRILLNKRWRDIGVGRRKGTFRGRRNTIVTTVDLGRRVSL